MSSEPAGSSSKTVRRVVLGAVGAIALVSVLVTLPTIAQPAGVFGWNIGPNGVSVISVTRGYPAARAGIVPGDRLVYGTLSLRARLNTIAVTPVHPGDRISFTVLHHGVPRDVTLEARQWPIGLSVVSAAVSLLTGIVWLMVAIALVSLRPHVGTWALLVYAASSLTPFRQDAWAAPTDAGMAAALASASALGGVGVAAAFVFIGRFPNGEVRPWTRWLDRLAIPWALLSVSGAVAAVWLLVESPNPPPHALLLTLQYVLPALGTVIVLAALIANYAAAAATIRPRILPVLVTFGCATLFSFTSTIVNNITTTEVGSFGTIIVRQLFAIAFAVSVAYAVVRHRVMGVNFVISRTLVYTMLTAFIVCTFALIHYLVGRWLERTGVAFILELVVAIAYGVWLNALHGRLDRWVDRVLFRRRHLAENRLLRVAHALAHADSTEFVDDMLVDEPADALALASAAIFRRDGDGAFARVRSRGWSDECAASLGSDDRLIVELTALLAPLDLSQVRLGRHDLPGGTAQPIYAIPLCVRHRLQAVALYGGHDSGEALDPNETRILRLLVEGGAAAYDHIAAAALAKKVEQLERENAGLRLAGDALREAATTLNEQVASLGRLLGATQPR